MATTQRLGIDIVGSNKTNSAFAGVQRSIGGLNRSVSQFKTAFAGLAGGNLLASFTRSMVNINKASLPVKTSIDNLGAAWTQFGLKVGEGGLNTALINFADRMNKMLSGTDGLSSSIGKLMGGAVNTMSNVFEGIGRSIAFVYDNFAFFNRVAFAFIGIKIAQNIAFAGLNFLRFAAAVRSTGLAMGIFNVMTSLGKKGILGLAAGGLVLAYAFDDVKKIMDDMIKKMEVGLGPAFESVRKGMEALGFDTRSLQMELAGGVIGQGMPGSELDDKIAKVGGLKTGFKGLNETGLETSITFKEVGQTLSSAFSQGFDSIIDGTSSVKQAFASMAKSILSSLASMQANKLFAGLFGSLFSAVIPTMLTGYNASGPGGTTSLGGFGGFYAKGGTLGAGKWGIAGENGPEVVRGPASIIPSPNRGGGQTYIFAPKIDARGADSIAIARLTNELRIMQRDFAKNVKNTVTGEKSRNPRFAT